MQMDWTFLKSLDFDKWQFVDSVVTVIKQYIPWYVATEGNMCSKFWFMKSTDRKIYQGESG